MASTLETLIRLAEFEVDERRRALKELLDKEDRLKLDREKLKQRVEQEKVASQQDLQSGMAFSQFIQWAKLEDERLDKVIKALQPEIEHARGELSEAFAEQKKVEITKERRDEEEQNEIKAKEQKFLDEFTTGQFYRKKEQEE